MNNEKTSAVVNVSFLGLLALLFIALKLLGYVTWSWWWVLAPLWIPWSLVAVVGACVFVVLVVHEMSRRT